MITNWEASGNGAGQRAPDDDQFGQYDPGNVGGDNRASFINLRLGHKHHHLYLWYLADKMGVLKNVLNILSTDVAADGDRVHKDTSSIQQARRRNNEDEKEKLERRAFRMAVGSSLTAIAITAKQEALRKEEDKVERFTIAAMEADEENNEKKRKYYDNLASHHGERVSEYFRGDCKDEASHG